MSAFAEFVVGYGIGSVIGLTASLAFLRWYDR